MARLIGYVLLSADTATLDIEDSLNKAATWLSGIMVGQVTRSLVRSSKAAFVSLCHTESDFENAPRKVAVVDAGPVFSEEKNLAANVAQHLTNSNRALSAELSSLRGDFAGALFDLSNTTLHLFRDHVGSRPMYYYRGDGFVAFSSHPAALLYFPGCSRRCNRRHGALVACSHYRTFDNEPGESPFKDIAQVPIASVVTLSIDKTSVQRYWDLVNKDWLLGSEQDLSEQYQQHILTAVRRRLSAPGKRGFTLSGGMDSSSVLASAVKILGGRQEAYSCVYSDKTYDESADIASILEDAVEEWHRIPVDSPDVFDVVRKMVALHGESVATATWLSHHELIRKSSVLQVEVLFGGLGGDELNAGEYEHFFPFFADLRASNETELLENEITAWAQHHDHPVYKKNRSVAFDTLARVTDSEIRGRCIPDLERQNRYLFAYGGAGFDLGSYLPLMAHPFDSYLNNRAYQDLFFETTPCCLRAQDRHGAAYGITHVNPFLDVDVVEYMFRIPAQLKIRSGVTKYLLRQAMKGVLTESTRTRVAKTGWNAPAHLWFSSAGLNQVKELVNSSDFRLAALYDHPALQSIIREHEEIVSSNIPRANHMMFLWQLVNLEAWFREFNVEW